MAANILFVHAHPDDEAIWTGGLIARLIALGHKVTVVTCTLGEEGETLGERYQGLVTADQMGGFRLRELEESLKVLGAAGVFLGGLGRWRDSGMAGSPAHNHPRAFVNSGEEATTQLVELIESLSPALVVTYDPTGGYGHPDHIQAHRIAHAAVNATGRDIPILWSVTDTDTMIAGLQAIIPPPVFHTGEIATQDGPHDIELVLNEQELAAKVAAMKCHPTQVWVADGSTSVVNPAAAFGTSTNPAAAVGVWALSNLVAQPILPREHYQLGAGDVKKVEEILGD